MPEYRVTYILYVSTNPHNVNRDVFILRNCLNTYTSLIMSGTLLGVRCPDFRVFKHVCDSHMVPVY